MSERMKVLIAYDGSECADAALEDLRRAGLPPAVEAVVITAADVYLPPSINEGGEDTSTYVPEVIRRAHQHAARAVEEASEMAERAAARVKTSFPGWEVRSEAEADSPAWNVIKKADELGADLIIVGAQGYNVLGGRLILGSVSQRVLYEARSSVRVARHSKGRAAAHPLRLLIATDGSPDAEATVAAVAGRVWPPGSEARLLCVLDTIMEIKPAQGEPAIMRWVEAGNEEDIELLRKTLEPSAEKLRKAGLSVEVITAEGNPKSAIVEEASQWDSDSIFIGAKGIRGIDRLLLGSVSAAVAARAHCTVEVVRPKSVS